MIANGLGRLGTGIQNLPNTLGANLYPVDPSVASQVDPAALEQARRSALIRAGLGFSAASQQGAGFGQAALYGMNQGQGPMEDSLTMALKMKQAQAAAARQAQMDALETEFKKSQTTENYARAGALLNPPPKEYAPDHTLIDIVDKSAPGGYRTISRSQFTDGMQQYHKPAAAGAAAGPKQALSPDALDDAVVDVLADPNRMRQYASFGQSGQDLRVAINNAKAAKLKDIGMTEQEVIRQQAVAKGQIKSVGDLIPMQNAVAAYETLARGNGERALELINKVNTTGIPALNSAKRLGEQASGNPDAAELMSVLQTYQTEVARIIANPRLVGQLTDTARHEVQNIVPANMTPPQAKRVISRLNFEFGLRQKGINDAIEQAKSGMTPGFNTPPPAAAQAPAAASPSASAPAQALDYLKAHPEAKAAFQAKYGYLPSGY